MRHLGEWGRCPLGWPGGTSTENAGMQVGPVGWWRHRGGHADWTAGDTVLTAGWASLSSLGLGVAVLELWG